MTLLSANLAKPDIALFDKAVSLRNMLILKLLSISGPPFKLCLFGME
jgi:hypothetical protein